MSVISERKDEKRSTSGYSTGWWLLHFLAIWLNAIQALENIGLTAFHMLGECLVYPLGHYTQHERPPLLSRPHLNLQPFR